MAGVELDAADDDSVDSDTQGVRSIPARYSSANADRFTGKAPAGASIVPVKSLMEIRIAS